MSDHLSEPSGGPSTPETEHPYGKPYTAGEYGRGCRCEFCKKAKANQYQERQGKEAPYVIPTAPGEKPKRPPGVVWLDWSGITAVVRCERCQKNYGVWLTQDEGAEFAKAHAYLHAGEPPFDWTAYDAARLMKNPGGRPPIEVKPLCASPECTQDARSKGLCDTHYRAHKRASERQAS